MPVLLLCFVLANCAGRAKSLRNIAPCPEAVLPLDTLRFVTFVNPDDTSNANIGLTGEIYAVKSNCRYVEGEPIRAELEVDMAIGRGPAYLADDAVVVFYIAVVSSSGDVLSKQTYRREVKFERGASVLRMREAFTPIVIPRKDQSVNGRNFQIAAGFVMDGKTLLYNRAGHSQKFPDLLSGKR